jgi:LruC domain-containing protein
MLSGADDDTKLTLTAGATTILGGNGDRSLIKVNTITGGKLDGNITIETLSGTLPTMTGGAESAGYDQSSVYIQACQGEGNAGNEGSTPTNPEFPYVIPSGAVYTYMFEDLWPLYGDYDMNDVVFKVDNFKTIIGAGNAVPEIQFDWTMEAVGASYPIAVALQLDQTQASNVASVSYSSATISDYKQHVKTFQVNGAGVEIDETYAVIPLADEVHALFGRTWFINTVSGRDDGRTAPVTVTVTIRYATPVDPLQVNINNLNFFIMSNVKKYPVDNGNGLRRREVHLVNYPPTSKADTSVFGYHNDNTPWTGGPGNGKYTYISKQGLAWAISVPDDARWMNEWTNIREGYLQIEDWMRGVLDPEGNPLQWWAPNGENTDDAKLYTLAE